MGDNLGPNGRRVSLRLAVVLIAATSVAAQAPAPTLKSPMSPRAAPDADGFIRRWLMLEPIASTGLTENIVREAVRRNIFPANSRSSRAMLESGLDSPA